MPILRLLLRRRSLIILASCLLVSGILGLFQATLYARAHRLDCTRPNAIHHPRCDAGVQLFVRGVIHPGGGLPPVSALATSEGRVLRLGTDDELLAAYPSASKLDLKGMTVLPGFHDVRTHLLAGGLGFSRLDLRQALGISACQDKIQTFLRTHPDDPWIFGHGWSVSSLGGQSLSRRLLDAIPSDRPMMMWRDDFRAVALNSKALSILQIDKRTPDTYLGRVLRDKSNVPTGILEGEAADDAFRKVVAKLPTHFIKEGYLAAQNHLLQQGLTRVGEQLPGDLTPLVALRELIRDGLWRLRVTTRGVQGRAPLWPGLWLKTAYPETSRVSAPVLILDGSILTRHAALSEPWPLTPGRVDPRFSVSSLSSLLEQVAMPSPILLAEGDRALHVALEALENAPSVPQPLVVSALWNAEALTRAQARGVVPVLRPALLAERAGSLRAELPDHVFQMLTPMSLLSEQGGVLSSAWPETAASPLRLLGWAMQDAGAEQAGAEAQASVLGGLSLEQALRAYTERPAQAVGLGQQEGLLQPGYYADMVVLERLPNPASPDEIDENPVVMTLVGGEVVWRQEGGLQLQVDLETLRDAPPWRKALARQHFWKILMVLGVLNWPLISLALWMWQRSPRSTPPPRRQKKRRGASPAASSLV